MKHVLTSALALSLCVPFATVPVPVLAADAVPAYSASLAQLLDYIVGENQVVQSAIGNFDAEFDKSFAADGSGVEAEAQFPGLKEAVRHEAKEEMLAVLRGGYPELRSAIGDLVSARMTATEIREASIFYGSPTGQKMIGAAVKSARGSTPDAIRSSSQEAALGSIEASDNASLIAFGRSSAFPKIKELGPEMQKVSIDWANALIAANDARMKERTMKAVVAHIAKINAQRRGSK